MGEHPIQGLMQTAMENIKEMVDVNTIIGDPVETPDGNVIIPVSKVGFGFAAGGSEFEVYQETEHRHERRDGDLARQHANGNGVSKGELPFGGGSGGGISITPVAFLIVGKHGVRSISLQGQSHLYERMMDLAPAVVEKIQSMIRGDDKDHTKQKDCKDRNERKNGEEIIDELH